MRTGAVGAGRMGAVPMWLLGSSVLLSPCLEHAPGALQLTAELPQVPPSSVPILSRALGQG